MRNAISFAAAFAAVACALGQSDEPRTKFRVTYVASGALYLDGGSDAGLTEGLHLTVTRRKAGAAEMEARVISEVVVVSLAPTSAACEVKSKNADPEVGDTASLSPADAENARMLQSSHTAHKYAQVVSFSDGDPLDEEARKYVPRPPLPEINRIRGRIAFEQNSIIDHGSAPSTSNQEGIVLRADMTRIGGTFWNFTGYWRGRFNSNSSSAASGTLTDLLNRTYTIGLYYNNPESAYTAGFGRLYLPWAPSLDTIDGGYVARRITDHMTAGIFAGTTPDPAAWNYDPNRQMGGAFVNWAGGTFENVRYSSTAGIALTRVHWHPERQFAFFENSVFYKRIVSIYHDVEADEIARNSTMGLRSGPQLSRSFLTVRIQPNKRLSFDLNHNYFRGLPTFDTRLLGTGLLDKFLFQGFSAGVQAELPLSLTLYATLGRNSRDTDARASLNQMYGLTLRRIWFTDIRADFRYSTFNTSFGSGNYTTVSLSRDLAEKLRVELQGGEQNIQSPLTRDSRARFITSNFDWFFSAHYSTGGGVTVYRGRTQDYDQIYFNLGYRF